MEAMIRTHVLLPRKLVEKIDARAGPRKRSEYIAEVLEEQLRRESLRKAADRAAGAIPAGAVREWDTRESITSWVRDQRRGDDPWAESVAGHPGG